MSADSNADHLTSSPQSWSSRAVLWVQVALVAACALEAYSGQELGANSSFVLAVITVAAVALRRWAPVGLALLAGPAMGWSALSLAPVVLLFSAGHREPRRWVLITLVAWTVLSSALLSPWPPLEWFTLDVAVRLAGGLLMRAVLIAGAVGLGQLLRVHQAQTVMVGELVAGRAREQALAEHAARADERAGLAREMHDVVASQVTLIAVQAGALRMVSPGDRRVQEIAEVIRAAAAATTRELREVLTALRTAPADALADRSGEASVQAPVGPPAAQLCLEQVRRLWQDSGCAGELVMHLPGEVAIPAQVQRAGYRIVQEGLTNAVRYAPGAQVRVGVEVVFSTLVVSVINAAALAADPASPAQPSSVYSSRVDQPAGRSVSRQGPFDASVHGEPSGQAAPSGQAGLPADLSALSTGYGLRGVRERAEAVGGHASWAALDSGGFQLVAVLPLP